MPLVARSKVLSELNLFFPSLRKIINDGWDDYQKYPNDYKIVHGSGTRATIVHDHQIYRAGIFAIENGFNFINISGMRVLMIGNYAIRFKKLTEKLLSSNQPTKQVEQFRNQDALPGFPETHNLEVGYVLNVDNTEIYKICLVQPSGKSINWALDLIDTHAEVVIEDMFEKFDTNMSDHDTNNVTIRGKRNNIHVIRKNED